MLRKTLVMVLVSLAGACTGAYRVSSERANMTHVSLQCPDDRVLVCESLYEPEPKARDCACSDLFSRR